MAMQLTIATRLRKFGIDVAYSCDSLNLNAAVNSKWNGCDDMNKFAIANRSQGASSARKGETLELPPDANSPRWMDVR
jgi:hypothetical protein